jgi:hypothetical protein
VRVRVRMHTVTRVRMRARVDARTTLSSVQLHASHAHDIRYGRPSNAKRAEAVPAGEHHRRLETLLAELALQRQLQFSKLLLHHPIYHLRLHLARPPLPFENFCTPWFPSDFALVAWPLRRSGVPMQGHRRENHARVVSRQAIRRDAGGRRRRGRGPPHAGADDACVSDR